MNISPRYPHQSVWAGRWFSRKSCHRGLLFFFPLDGFVSGPIHKMLEDCGITQLYSHQHNAIQAIRDGRHVVTATPTASGKTVVYNIPFFETLLENPNARAIYLFPLKALAQDQLKSFQGHGVLSAGG